MLVFVDGSCRAIPTDPNSHSAFAAVLLREEDSREVSRHLYNLKQARFSSDQVEMKASSLINRGTFHKRSKVWQIGEQFFELIRQSPVTVFGVIMERPLAVSAEPIPVPEEAGASADLGAVAARLPDYYRFLLQRVQLHMEAVYPSSNEMAVVVFDEDERHSDEELARSFASFMYRSQEGHRARRIVETCHFGNSTVIPGLQVADFCASVLRQAEQNGVRTLSPWVIDDAYKAAIKRYYQIVADKSVDYPNASMPGQTLYGVHLRRVRRLRVVPAAIGAESSTETIAAATENAAAAEEPLADDTKDE